jgi:hypothetical protein
LETGDLEVSGQGRDRSDPENPPPGSRSILEDTDQLFAGLENEVRVVQGDPPRFGQDERFAFSREEWLPKVLFQLAKLDAQGGLGNSEMGSCLGEAAFLGDGSEVAKMVIVEHCINRSEKQNESYGKI